jgi:hypothetical protein
MRRTRPRVEEIEDAETARTRLFEIERDLLHDPEHGVVLLVAEREEEIEATHGQYFKTLDELGELVS